MFESSIWSFIRLLISLPIVLILAYYGTRFIISHQLIQNNQKNGTMRVVDRIQLGPKSFLSIVEVNGSYYLLSTTESTVSLIRELHNYKPPEIVEHSFESNRAALNFQEILNKQVTKVKNKLRGENGNGNWNR